MWRGPNYINLKLQYLLSKIQKAARFLERERGGGRERERDEHCKEDLDKPQDVVLKTYLGRWTIGRSGERGSGISVLPARYDDDEGNKIK